MDDYRRSDWFKYRDDVIELHGDACSTCGRTAADGVVLQVHHKRYIPDFRPWEYDFEDCEALCRGCHGREHGHLRPAHGWSCVGHHDLEDLIGTCELCGTSLRHVFLITHPKWSSMEVGENCCDNLTCTSEASTHMESKHRYVSRLKCFVQSRRWRQVTGGVQLRQRKVELKVAQDGDRFRLWMNGFKGKLTFATLVAAKAKAFDLIESGEIASFLRKAEAKRRAVREQIFGTCI